MEKKQKKKFAETRVGKFLKSRGLNTVLEVVGDVVPGVGIFNEVKKAILPSNDLSPADKDIFLDLMKLDVQELEAVLDDKKNARERELKIRDRGDLDWMMITTGVVALLLLIFIAVVMVFIELPSENRGLFHNFIGIIEGAAISIFTYYFGSSRGSKLKTDILKNRS